VHLAAPAAVAGQPLPVSIDVQAGVPVQVFGGVVELIRSATVTHRRRNWTGAGSSVAVRTSAVAARADVDLAGPLLKGEHAARQVLLLVPADEATIAGSLVQQEYAVRVQVHTRDGVAVVGASPVRVAGPASWLHRMVDVPPVVAGADFAALGIEELSSRRLRAGVPLSGVVTVTPRRAGAVRGARVEVVLAEHTRARPGEPLEEDCDATTVLASVGVGELAHLEPGADLRLPFTVPVPDPLPAPSLGTPEFGLRWLVRAVLDRPLHPDASATRELLAGSTRC
jgi:hypothetical protein